jgi:hypothetical protein
LHLQILSNTSYRASWTWTSYKYVHLASSVLPNLRSCISYK